MLTCARSHSCETTEFPRTASEQGSVHRLAWRFCCMDSKSASPAVQRLLAARQEAPMLPGQTPEADPDTAELAQRWDLCLTSMMAYTQEDQTSGICPFPRHHSASLANTLKMQQSCIKQHSWQHRCSSITATEP